MKATVNNIPTYTLNGTTVYLADMDDVPGVTPIEHIGNIGAYPIESYNGCSVLCTTDDSYSCESECGTAIVAGVCVNPDNGQRLVEGWWTVDYYQEDCYKREYITVTDQYYDWISARKQMIDRIEEESHEGIITAGTYNKYKDEWDAAVTEAVRGCRYHSAGDASFDDLLEEAYISVVQPMTSDSLIDAVQRGAVYCSNADAAHTDDYPADRDDIIKTIQEQGFRELDPATDDYADGLARLDLYPDDYARIFHAGCYTLAPDSLM